MNARAGLACLSLALGVSIVLCAAATAASAFPARPVRFLVGYAPGGGADVLARFIARRLSESWGQPVVVENRAGAGGTIAASVVANAPPDGHTLILITSNHTVPSSELVLSYDPVRSFAPVVEAAYIPSALVAAPSIKITSVRELIDLARAKPGALNFGSSGPGTAQFMDMQLLMQVAGISMTNVTYKGAAPILIAMLANEVQVALQPITAYLEPVRSGKVKALAVTGKVRSRLLPDVPTCAETGVLRGFEGSANWYGIVAPAGTPRAIVTRVHDDVVATLNQPEMQRALGEQGMVVVGGTPGEFAKRIADDVVRWGKAARSLPVK
jgi:tripartite-type tricarboxylate transporter receptor subunit TctC